MLESKEDLGVELCPGDIGRKSEFHEGREVFVDVVGGVEVGGEGEELSGDDGDVDFDCDGVEVGGEWVGHFSVVSTKPASLNVECIVGAEPIGIQGMFPGEDVTIRSHVMVDFVVSEVTNVAIGGVEELVDIVRSVDGYGEVEGREKQVRFGCTQRV